MLNIDIFKSKYNKLISESSKENSLKEMEKLKKNKEFNNLNFSTPILVYASNRRNEIFYMLALKASLLADRVLDYTIVSGQTISREHFLDGARDKELEALIYNNDLLLVSLSQFDYTSEYVESIIVDIIEFRKERGLTTFIHYDIIGSVDFLNTTKLLHNFFRSKNYQVVTLQGGARDTTVKKAEGKGRIL